jgi:hypothetical protein
MTELPPTGGCTCRAVRFEVTAPLVAAGSCPSAASPDAHPAEGAFRIAAGEDRLRMWKPEGGGGKWFCGDCGSSLFGRNHAHPDPIGIGGAARDGVAPPPARVGAAA